MTSVDEAWLEPATASLDALPRPVTERWQPLRLGLVDLFYYDDEQFWFHDGRLLLRGNNGTGKSKVLALTLPLLLDGSLAPRRVEPDADPKKRMEWNLLLGGAHPHSERTGYTWVEFGRLDDDGAEQFVTLGIGLKAAANRGIVKHWFFTTSRRVGELRLLDESGTVLSQERLRDAVGGSGQLHTTQESYRRAVDEALYRLGPERYAALVDLLIQLRQPQLSRRPDERALSAALTEALAPLDQAVVADVAESFRSLEEERFAIEDSRQTLAAAEAFLKDYRAYARVAARRRTTRVRLINSAFEHAGRDLAKAESDLAEASVEVERIAGAKANAVQRQQQLTGQDQALRESPEMRDAARLHDAETAAAEKEQQLAAGNSRLADARSRAQQYAAEQQSAFDRSRAASADADRRETVALPLAAAAGLAADHPQIRADEVAAGRLLDRRRDQIGHVRRLVGAAAEFTARADRLRSAVDTAEANATRRAEGVRTAGARVDETVGAYTEQVRRYVDALAVVVLDVPLDDLAEAAGGWARRFDGESPVRAAVDAAAGLVRGVLAQRRAAGSQEERQLAGRLVDLKGRIDALEAGADPEPARAPGRVAVPAHAAAAPLYQVTDFASGMPDARRAAVEAALQSAGILDAWMFADATLQADGDVIVGPSGAQADGPSLAEVLVPAVGPDSAVTDGAVAQVLSRIGLGADSGAALWVDVDGHWGAGPARGSWAKERAEFIGAGAREDHRRQLLAELRGEVTTLGRARSAALAEVAETDRLTTAVTTELADYPAPAERELCTAHADVAGAERELARAEHDVISARASSDLAGQQAAAAAAQLDETARGMELGSTPEDLDTALTAVNAYAEALIELRRSVEAAGAAAAVGEQAAARTAEADRLLADHETSVREVHEAATRLRARADELQSTVGASVAQLQARLGETAAALTRVAEERANLESEQLEATARHATLDERVRELAIRREERAAERADVIEALRTFADTGLLRVALAELDVPDPGVPDGWNVTAALALSRTAEQHLEATDESDDAWSRAQQRVSTAQTTLAAQMSRHGHTAWVEQHDDVLVARVRYLSDEVDIDRLAERLAADVAERERLLSAREREILENHLVNEVAGHLHELLLAAEGQITRINTELAHRKTSTGMQLRVRWQARSDGPAGLVASRALMLRSDATWTPGDRSAIGDFLQAQIAAVRQTDPTGSWNEHLEQALDYRQWHSFVVERWQNGQWRSASGPASGGEKVLAVSVPLFAAAAAHYNSAGRLAPRLILLDEAFAGVDDDSRAKSLGLLAVFDLDVVMTSEREWGCYPQVPGLAIAQLSRAEGVDAVGVTRWRWDGQRRTRLDDVPDGARAGEFGASPPEQSLFG